MRIHDITGIQFFGNNALRSLDIPISERSGNRYIDVAEPGRTYCVDLGVVGDFGYRCLARSNSITTPQAEPSETIDPAWPVSDAEYRRLQELVNRNVR